MQGIRLYPRDQSCDYLLRVLRDPKNRAESGIEVETGLLSGGKPVRRETRQLPTPIAQLDSGGWLAVGGSIHLAGLEPGLYELQVTVRDPVSRKSADRTVVFGIE